MAPQALKLENDAAIRSGGISADTSLRSRVRHLVPDAPRELASAALRRLLGPRWAAIGFRHIDQTPLRALSKSKLFEPELKLLPLLISKPGSVFDVGANIGEYTYVLGKTVGPEHVYAIEPVPRLCSRLRGLFPKAHVLQMALSDAAGTLTLKTPIVKGSPLWTRSTLEGFVDDGETGAVLEQVPVMPLDSLCEQLHVCDVACIKIDVEGHEESVLRGALGILRTCHPVLLVEIEQRHHVKPISGLFSWIQAQGYLGLFFDGQAMSLRSVEEFSVGRHQQLGNLGNGNYINNFLFLKECSAKTIADIVDRAANRETGIR
jgi:FkbM family methyltransferase